MPAKKRQPSAPSADRFWSKVDRSAGASACWPWLAASGPGGYGWVWMDGNSRRAHRIAWQLTNGPIPSGLCVLHRCDNRPCCNPAHLFLGTKAENNADMYAKGRARRPAPERAGFRLCPERAPSGERNGSAKITEDDVRAIRAWRASGYSAAELAVRYGVHHETIRKIENRRLWRHVA